MFVAGGGSWLAGTGSDRARRDTAQLVCGRGCTSSTARGSRGARARGGTGPPCSSLAPRRPCSRCRHVRRRHRAQPWTCRSWPRLPRPQLPLCPVSRRHGPHRRPWRSSSEEGIEIEEIDEGQKYHFPWPVYVVRSSWRATSAKMARMYQMLSLDGKYVGAILRVLSEEVTSIIIVKS